MEEYRPSQKLLETLDRHPQSLYRYRMILTIIDYMKYQSRQLGVLNLRPPSFFCCLTKSFLLPFLFT